MHGRTATEPQTKKLLYTINEACEALGRRRTKIYELLVDGRLEGVKLDAGTMITAASVNRLIASLPPAEIGKNKTAA